MWRKQYLVCQLLPQLLKELLVHTDIFIQKLEIALQQKELTYINHNLKLSSPSLPLGNQNPNKDNRSLAGSAGTQKNVHSTKLTKQQHQLGKVLGLGIT